MKSSLEQPSNVGRTPSRPSASVLLSLSLPGLIAFAPLVLLSLPFWDDWVIVWTARDGQLWEMFRQAGRVEHYFLLLPFALAAAPQLWVLASVLIYSVFLPVAVTLICRTALRWSLPLSIVAGLLTATAPLNQARFFISVLPYAFSCLFFGAALLLLVRDLKGSAIWRRSLVFLLLILSFPTNSFITISWIAPLVVALDAVRTGSNGSVVARLRHIVDQVLRRGELIAAPFIYWLTKIYLQPTYGNYANYNKFRMGVFDAFVKTGQSVADQLSGARLLIPRMEDLPQLAILSLATFLVLYLLVRRSVRLNSSAASPSLWERVFGAFCGLILVIAALFPYIIVEQPPRYSGFWETRHQTTLLCVFGVSLILWLRLFLPERVVVTVGLGMALVFLISSFSTAHRLMLDTLAVRSVMRQLPNIPIPAGTMVLLIESDREYRTYGRHFPFYEISHLLNEAREPGERVLALSNREVLDPATDDLAMSFVPKALSEMAMLCDRFREMPQFGFGGFSSNGLTGTLTFRSLQTTPGPFATLRDFVSVELFRTSPPELVAPTYEVSPISSACNGKCCL